MKKALLFLLCYAAVNLIAQAIDSTTYFLDKTEITSGVLYPYLENDSTALWLKFYGNTNNIANNKQWKQIYAEYLYYQLTPNIKTQVKK